MSARDLDRLDHNVADLVDDYTSSAGRPISEQEPVAEETPGGSTRLSPRQSSKVPAGRQAHQERAAMDALYPRAQLVAAAPIRPSVTVGGGSDTPDSAHAAGAPTGQSRPEPCPECHGDGEVSVPGYSVNPFSGTRVVDPQCEGSACCPACHGTGETDG